jgi:hypothetical protein
VHYFVIYFIGSFLSKYRRKYLKEILFLNRTNIYFTRFFYNSLNTDEVANLSTLSPDARDQGMEDRSQRE